MMMLKKIQKISKYFKKEKTQKKKVFPKLEIIQKTFKMFYKQKSLQLKIMIIDV